jgi:ABC-type branched-subunit amino acid transport system substrate-binding protein
MKTSYKILVSIVVVIVIIILLVSNTQKKTSIAIGAVIPETGFGGYWGKPELNGIKLAEVDLKKKYGDENVTVTVEDGQSAIPASVSAAQKLLSVNKVNGVYAEFSGPAAAISPVVKSAGKILVYSTFNQKIVEDNEYSIKTFVSFEPACEKFAQYVKDPTKKILLISSIGDAAPYCERALLKTFARENVKVVDSFVGTDFRTLLLQNKSFNPDFIIPIMYEDGSYALIKQKVELGMKANIFGYRQDSMTEKILKELPTTYTDGVVTFELPIDPAFYARIKAAYPDMTDDDIQAASNGYQSIVLLGDALAQCPNGEATCTVSKVANLKTLEHPGYKNAFVANRILQSEILIGVVKGGKVIVE